MHVAAEHRSAAHAALLVALLLGSAAAAQPAGTGSGPGAPAWGSGAQPTAPLANDGSAPPVAAAGAPATGGEAGPVDGSGQPAVDAPAPAAPTVEVTLSALDPALGPIGALRALDVTVQVPVGAAVQGLSIDERTFVEIVRIEEIGASGDPTQVTRRLWLTAFRTGTHAVPGVVVRGIDASGQPFEATSAPFELAVNGVTVNESDPAPTASEPPVAVLIRDMRPVWAAVVVGAGALGALLWSLWRRRAIADVVAPPPPPRAPLEVALEKLTQLAHDGLLESAEHLAFHERLSAIVREFVGRVWGFDGVERTTTEIRDEVLARPDAQRWEPRLSALLGDTDLIKFARFTPPVAMSERLLVDARELVLDIAARIQEQATPAEVPSPPVDESLPPADDNASSERT